VWMCRSRGIRMGWMFSMLGKEQHIVSKRFLPSWRSMILPRLFSSSTPIAGIMVDLFIRVQIRRAMRPVACSRSQALLLRIPSWLTNPHTDSPGLLPARHLQIHLRWPRYTRPRAQVTYSKPCLWGVHNPYSGKVPIEGRVCPFQYALLRPVYRC